MATVVRLAVDPAVAGTRTVAVDVVVIDVVVDALTEMLTVAVDDVVPVVD